MAEHSTLSVPVYPPRGFHQASVDDKGRLKLPVAVSRYLALLPDKKFFVTSFGTGPVRLYPNSIWQKNLQFFEEFSEDPEPVRKIAFLADAFGGDAEIDGQGRVLLPPGLRRKFALESNAVQLPFFPRQGGHLSASHVRRDDGQLRDGPAGGNRSIGEKRSSVGAHARAGNVGGGVGVLGDPAGWNLPGCYGQAWGGTPA